MRKKSNLFFQRTAFQKNYYIQRFIKFPKTIKYTVKLYNNLITQYIKYNYIVYIFSVSNKTKVIFIQHHCWVKTPLLSNMPWECFYYHPIRNFILPQTLELIFYKSYYNITTDYKKLMREIVLKLFRKNSNYLITGIKVVFSGRLLNKAIASKEVVISGSTSAQSLYTNIEYKQVKLRTKNGILGIKIYLFMKNDN